MQAKNSVLNLPRVGMAISKVKTQMPDALTDFNGKIKRIREALEDYYLSQENDKLGDFEVISISQRGFSTITLLRGRTSKGYVKFVSKTIVHHPVNIVITKKENQAVVEYNVLKTLHPKFEAVDGCSVPCPILVIPEIETYVMEFVEGNLLADEFRFARYFSPTKKFRTLKAHYHNCGLWLKHFQKFTGMHEEGPEALTGVMERCDYRLKLIENLNDLRWPKDLRNKVMGYLQEQFEEMKGHRIYVSGRHGDFGSWNILAGPSGVTVIDYLGYGEDPVPVDILKMLMNFEDEKKYLAYNPLRIRDLKESFLKGYGSLPSILPPALVICETFHRICSLLASLSNNGGRLHHRIERQICLKSNLKWLTDERHRKLLWPVHNIQI